MNTTCRDRSSVCALTLKTVAMAAAISVSSLALAAENGEQRYAPGVGGSDMSTPVQPGWYGQVAMVAYHASKLKGNDGKDAYKTGQASQSAIAAGIFASGLVSQPVANGAAAAIVGATGANGAVPVRFKANLTTDIVTVLPRLTYISSEKLWGGNLGVTAMLPLMQERTKISASNTSLPASFVPTATAVFTPALGAGNAALAANGLSSKVQSGTADAVSAESGRQFGIGDLEIAPIIHWEIGDHQSAGLAATIIIPTGDYDASRLVNVGFGNYYTFRPSAQYAYIGDGWDIAGRAVLSINSRNKDTQYRTGTILNLDYAVMKFVSDDVRVGLQGYVVRQLSSDSQDASTLHPTTDDLSTGNKMQVYSAGPAVAWLKNGGEFLLEGKFLQEFGAKNRTEGQTFWLTLSKPL